MPNAGSFHVYSTVRLDNIKLLVFNYLTYRNVNVIYFTNSRSLNNTCICLPHPSPGSSVLFGSWKSRNHTRYFAVVIGGSWDVLHRSSFRKKKQKTKNISTPSGQLLGVLPTDISQLSALSRECLICRSCFAQCHAHTQGKPHLITYSRGSRKVQSSKFNL